MIFVSFEKFIIAVYTFLVLLYNRNENLKIRLSRLQHIFKKQKSCDRIFCNLFTCIYKCVFEGLSKFFRPKILP